MDVSTHGRSGSWRDEHDARLPVTRANLHSQNDLTAQPKKPHPAPVCQRSNKALLLEA
jgi:hypothetical protein